MVAETPGKHAIFGDGTPIVIKSFNDKGDNWEIGFRTSNTYEKHHGITERDKDVATGLIYKEYPKIFFHVLDPNPDTERWLIACSFDNKSTNLIKQIGEQLYNKAQAYRQLLISSEIREAGLREQIRRLSREPLKFYKTDIIPLATELNKLQVGQGGGTGAE